MLIRHLPGYNADIDAEAAKLEDLEGGQAHRGGVAGAYERDMKKAAKRTFPATVHDSDTMHDAAEALGGQPLAL